MQGESCPGFFMCYLRALWKVQSWLTVLEVEIGLEGDGWNISKHVPGNECPCCCVLWIRFPNFTMNIVCLRANTDVCDVEGTTACLWESSIVDVEMSHKLGLIFIRLLTRHLCSCGCQWVQHGKKKSVHSLFLFSTVISHFNEHKNNWTTGLSVKRTHFSVRQRIILQDKL